MPSQFRRMLIVVGWISISLLIAPLGMLPSSQGSELWSELREGSASLLTNTVNQVTGVVNQMEAATRWVWDGIVPSSPVEIDVLYNPEKQGWMTWAVDAFAKTPNGATIRINLIPLQSLAGGKALLTGQHRPQVWIPSNSLARELFVHQWLHYHGRDPIITDTSIALSPLVIAMRMDRYEAFIKRYQIWTPRTFAAAMAEPGGWYTIAHQPNWGLVTLSYSVPSQSTSGMLTLLLFAYDFFGYLDRYGVVQPQDLLNERFTGWLDGVMEGLELDTYAVATNLEELFQPDSLSAGQVTYENVALQAIIDNPQAPKIKLIYTQRSFWNDHPFYILDVPWSSPVQRQAAAAFLQFLLSDEAQRIARDRFWLRPVVPTLSITDEDSAFRKHNDVVRVDVAPIKPPSPEVVRILLQMWQRYHAVWPEQ